MLKNRKKNKGVVYRNYNDIKIAVISAIIELISRAKGSCVTFTSKKIAQIAGLPTQPVLLTIVRDVLENLRNEGLIIRYNKTSHGVKYMITKESPLWLFAISKSNIKGIKTPYLAPILDIITTKS